MTTLSILSQLATSQIWQSVLIAAVLAVALGLGRKASGAARYAMASAAFAAASLLPLVALIPGEGVLAALLKATGAPISFVDQPVELHSAATSSGDVAPVSPAGSFVHDSPAEPPSSYVTEATFDAGELAAGESAPASLSLLPADFRLPDMTAPFLVIWAVGAAVLLLRTGRDLVATERLVASARPAHLPHEIARRMKGVRVVVSDEAPGPMAAGLLHPSVVLPAGADTALFETPGAGALLEHERAHIERRDTLVALAQRLALAIMWWSPALYWISRRMDEEREVACDEAAVTRTGDARAFARSLTRQAESQLWTRVPRLAVGAIGPRSQFGNRVRRLIEFGKSRGSSVGVAGRAGFAALALAAIAAACVTPVMTAGADGPQSPDEPYDLYAFQDESPPVPPAPPEPPAPPAPPEPLPSDFAALFADLEGGPEIHAELAALSAELGALGTEISAAVSAEVMAEMPTIMEEVRLALEEASVHSPEAREEMRRAMEEARAELERELGPELQEELRRSLQQARLEIQAGRDEMRAALDDARKRERFSRGGDFDVRLGHDQLDGGRVYQANATAPRSLYRAAAHGDVDRVRDLIKAGADVNAVIPGDGTPLIAAARSGETKVLRILLEAGADPNRRSIGDGTPLIVAAHRGEHAIVRALLDAGADPDKAVPGDGNPLIVAAANGEAGIVRTLIDRGADVNAYVPGDETPLMAAAYDGDLETVRLLVDRGAKVNLAYKVRTFEDGRPAMVVRSPLSRALEGGNEDVADFLKSRGAVANPKPAN